MTGAAAAPMNAPDLDDAHIGPYIAEHYLREEFVFASKAFGWMRFDGRRWEQVDDAPVAEAVRLGVLDLYNRAVANRANTAYLQSVSGLFSAHRMRSILFVARNYLWHGSAEFDAHPHLLNVLNGVVDLRDGNLLPHDRNLMLTRVAMTDYDPDARHDDWGQALTAVPEEVADWLQFRMGQGLTGYQAADDVLVVLRGSGENGKTTIVDGVRNALAPDHAVTLPDRVLLARTSDHPTELMTLRGARLAVMEEFPELGHLNVKRLKDLHGTGEMSARYCGKDTVYWTPSHTVFVTTNYLPRVDESDHGTWRRLALVEFPYRYRKAHEPIEKPNDRHGDPWLRERVREGLDKQHEAVCWPGWSRVRCGGIRTAG
jgi:putative DNA primase/helicase